MGNGGFGRGIEALESCECMQQSQDNDLLDKSEETCWKQTAGRIGVIGSLLLFDCMGSA